MDVVLSEGWCCLDIRGTRSFIVFTQTGKDFGVSKSMGVAERKLCIHLGRGREEKREFCCFISTSEFVYSSQLSVRVAHFQFVPQRHRIAVRGLKSLARQLCAFVTKQHERH